jgi:hypothetical protein
MSSIIKVDTIQDQDGNNIINENANTITIGKSGDTVTVALGATFVGGGIEWQSSIVTGITLSAVAGKGYWIDTTSNACTVTLPASASAGDQIIFVDYARTWNTNNLTININSLNYQGGTTNPVYTTDGQTVNIVYSGATQGWIPVSDDDVANEGNPAPYSADMLIVAGGGAGGQTTIQGGGGGGAGGFRTSTQTLTGAETYTITVGSGGAVGTLNNNTTAGQGGNGVDSSISGTGITTITSTGGGGGGAANANNTSGQAGKAGGSGGGGGAYGTNVGGSGNTPSTSPSQGNNGGHMIGQPYNGGGGGGGANAVGGNVTTNLDAGAGGDGTASSIEGSSITYAGGGAGGVTNPYPGTVPGGAGGGGVSGKQSVSGGGNGTDGLGGGGGGGGGTTTPLQAGTGGSGVVILSVPDANYSGTTTGSPTVTTGVSGKTIIKYTGSGSYTA